MMEDVAENINGLVDSSSDNLNVMCLKIEKVILISDPFPIKITENALLSFLLLLNHCKHHQAEERDTLNTFKSEKLDSVIDRIVEGVLRLLFCTGISEAIANACYKEAASVITLSRVEYTHFWDLVAFVVVNSSSQARDKAVKSVEFWGLRKGSISSLYSIFFTSKPIPSLQFAAYFILSNEPVLSIVVLEDNACNSNIHAASDEDISRLDMSIEEKVNLKEEISFMVELSSVMLGSRARTILLGSTLPKGEIRVIFMNYTNYICSCSNVILQISVATTSALEGFSLSNPTNAAMATCCSPFEPVFRISTNG